MKAYLFWYKSDERAPTEYIYIIAYTMKQARFFYIRQGYTRMYDYDAKPIDTIDEINFIKQHKVGDILGQYAVI